MKDFVESLGRDGSDLRAGDRLSASVSFIFFSCALMIYRERKGSIKAQTKTFDWRRKVYGIDIFKEIR